MLINRKMLKASIKLIIAVLEPLFISTKRNKKMLILLTVLQNLLFNRNIVPTRYGINTVEKIP
ncbi:hypothetical protein ASE92_12015 [Pedobacter sp. Leaf41]|nr:hypothetical protein ASE92_12015 [Pedobacter sp. Leaf41]